MASCCELSDLNVDFRESGTRFRLFAQSPVLPGFEEPETVWLSPAPEQIESGPGDDRMIVVDAIDKHPYEEQLPPYQGACRPRVSCAPDGHFDHLEVGTTEFEAAHMYGILRRVLDVWEAYFGRPVSWHFAADFDRMELIPWVDWNNAHCGYGYIEAGYRKDQHGRKFPMCLNFDVLAHEFGHAILYSELGLPETETPGAEFFAFHESCSDLVAIVSLLHFDGVVDLLLERTSGNLYAKNILNRVGEESPVSQIRMASNGITLLDVPPLNTPRERLTFKQLHHMGEPLTGAVFDVLVEIFQQRLLEQGCIDDQLDQLSRGGVTSETVLETVQQAFAEAYAVNPATFKRALVQARDHVGLLLADCWQQLDWRVTFGDFARAMTEAESRLGGGHYLPEITESFSLRGIEL